MCASCFSLVSLTVLPAAVGREDLCHGDVLRPAHTHRRSGGRVGCLRQGGACPGGRDGSRKDAGESHHHLEPLRLRSGRLCVLPLETEKPEDVMTVLRESGLSNIVTTDLLQVDAIDWKELAKAAQ